MNCLIAEDVPIGLYRSIDDINNFKIRICIRKVSPVCLPLPDSNKNLQTSEIELHPQPRQEKHIFTKYVFSWQEKVSKLEEKEMSTSSPSSSVKSSRTKESSSNQIRLFTYVDSELRSSEPKSIKIHHRYSKEHPILTKRHLFHMGANKTYQKPFIVDEKDVIQRSVSRKLCSSPGQSMTIMAVLDVESNSIDSEEVQLCNIHHEPNGVLIVTPDFSSNNNSYFVQNSSSETFEYTLHNASIPMRKSDGEKEKKFMRQICEHHENILSSVVEKYFDMPPADTAIWLINCELVSAEQFCSKYIFVRYTFQAGKGLELESDDLQSGTTHTSKIVMKNNVRTAEFGFPFSFALPIDFKQFSDSDALMPRLRLILEVTSVDSWGIFRNEGYGFCNIPFVPGCHSCTVHTWKLLPQTLQGKLKNFFIGGSPCLDTNSYVTFPHDFQGTNLSKYGVKTEASGSVQVKIQVLVHFGCETSPNDFINKQQVSSNY